MPFNVLVNRYVVPDSPDSRFLDPKCDAKLILKRHFGPLNRSSVLFLLSQGNMTLFLVQEWLDTTVIVKSLKYVSSPFFSMC